MRHLQGKRVFIIILVFVATFTFLFFPRTRQNNIRNEQIESLSKQGNITSGGIRYEATYIYKNCDGQIQTLVVSIPPRNPNLPNDYNDTTIEEQILEKFQDASQKLNIELPENFMDDVTIASMLVK